MIATPLVLVAALFELLYRYLLIPAYRVGDPGLVYPLMRGLLPLVVLAYALAAGAERRVMRVVELRSGALGHAVGADCRSGGAAGRQCDSGGAVRALPERTFRPPAAHSLWVGADRHVRDETLTVG